MDPDPGGTSIYTTGTQRNKKKYPKKRFSWKSENKDFLHRKHCDVLLQLLEILKDCLAFLMDFFVYMFYLKNKNNSNSSGWQQ